MLNWLSIEDEIRKEEEKEARRRLQQMSWRK
jgi:hypothetical protein